MAYCNKLTLLPYKLLKHLHELVAVHFVLPQSTLLLHNPCAVAAIGLNLKYHDNQ
mgnify:FL=1